MIFCMGLMLLSCQGSDAEQPEETTQFVENVGYGLESNDFNRYLEVTFPGALNEIRSKKQVIIIGNMRSGCKACIKEAWSLFDNQYYPETFFITDDHRIEQNNPHKNELLVEEINAERPLGKLLFMDIYPVLLEFDDANQITYMDFLKPNNEEAFKSRLNKGGELAQGL